MKYLFTTISFACWILLAASGGLYAQNVFKASQHIAEAFDDMEEYTNPNNPNVGKQAWNSTKLELGVEGGNNSEMITGLRFSNLRVPFGAVVTKAYIQFAKGGSKNTNPCELKIKVQNIGNSARFDTTNRNVASRTTLNDSVIWTPASWASLPVHGKSADERTPDLTRLVQGIVVRRDWKEGNAITFLITGTGNREAESFEGADAAGKKDLAPELVVEYVVPFTAWNFNGSTTTTVPGGTSSPEPYLGSGKAFLISPATASFASGTASGGSSDTTSTSPPNYGWNTTTYSSDAAGVRFQISTEGKENINLYFDMRFSNTASRWVKLQYTTDSVNFQDYNGPYTDASGGLYRASGGDVWRNGMRADFSNISGVANNKKFGIRITRAADPVSNTLVAANPASTFSTSGTIRFDMVTLSGTDISDYELQVLHASDLEAGLEGIVDVPRFAAVMEALEKTHSNTLILSSGDNFIPSPFLFAGEDASLQTPLRNTASAYFSGTQAIRAGIGRPDVAIMNIIGFKASCLGNHEFDLGTSELNSQIGVDIRNGGADRRWVGAQFPYLSANLDFSADGNLNYLFTSQRLNVNDFKTPSNISANSQKKGLAPSAIAVVGGKKIGLVGATTQVLQSISSPLPTRVVGPTQNDMPELAKILQPVIDSLIQKEGVNKVILLAHLQQLALEEELATLLKGVDLVIAGGSHTLLADNSDRLRQGDKAVRTYPLQTKDADGKNTLIVNTEANYRYVGRIVLNFDKDGNLLTNYLDSKINGAYATDSIGVATLWGNNYDSAFRTGTKANQVKTITDALSNVIKNKDGNIFGKASVFLEGRRGFVRTQETNLGNLSADANLWWARKFDNQVTVSLKNGGGIRSAMGEVYAVGSSVELRPTLANPSAGKEQGDISQLDIENSLRFNNRLWVVTTTASGLKTLIEHGISATKPGATPGQFPQVSGIRFSYDTTLAAGSRIRNMAIVDSLGNVIDSVVVNGSVNGNPNRSIKLVTLNFLATGGDSYPFSSVRVGNDLKLEEVPNPPAGKATFTVPGSEQDAFAEYMVELFNRTPYDKADTDISQDRRIQLLQAREDKVFENESGPFQLHILHASDLEAGLEAITDVPNFAAVVEGLEKLHPNSVVLSSGDNFIPSPFLFAGEDPALQTPLRNTASSYFSGTQAIRPAIGRPDVAIMNIIGFKASCLGNHEFDLGTSELNSQIGVDIRNSGADRRWVGAQFPYLSANLDFSADNNLNYLYTNQRLNVDAFKTPANISANSQKKGLAPSAILEVGGQKIGLVGATTQVLQAISSPLPTRVIGPTRNDMPELAKILQPVIDSLIQKEGINKIILLAHLQQLALEEELATLLKGVDIVIAGGSHTLLADSDDRLRQGDVAVKTYPLITKNADGDNCLVVNTEANYRYVGRLLASFDNAGKIITSALDSKINGAYATDSLGVTALWGNYSNAFQVGTKAGAVKTITDALAAVIKNKDGNLFGKTSVFLEGRRGFVRTEETNMGNISADANLWWARKFDKDVTVSLKNGGGIRSAIGEVYAVGSDVELRPTAPNPLAGKQRGDISQLDIENSLRFNNRLWVVTTNASGLKTLIEHGISATRAGATPGQFPQVSGVRFSYDTAQAAGSRIRNLVVLDSLGNAADTIVLNGALYGSPTRTIKLVTLNFLANGGDSYPFATVRVGNDLKLDEVSNPPAGKATFTVPGSEQDAFAEYMAELFSQTPYSVADTKIQQDRRIQLVGVRSDSVFDATTTWNGVSWSNGIPDDTKVAVIAANYNTAANGNITALRIRVAMGRNLTLGNDGRIEAIESIQNMGTIDNCAGGSIVSQVYAGTPALRKTVDAPTTRATNLTLTAQAGNALNITWTSGNGQNRIVVLKPASAVSPTAIKNGISYNADANFGGNGSVIEGGKVVYAGSSNSVRVSGLDPNVSYFAAVFEYNTDPSCGNQYGAATASSTGVTGLDATQIGAKIFPNPAKETLNVQLQGKGTINLMSLSGVFVAGFEVENEAVLPLSGLAKGLYLVEIKTEKGRAIQKLIVE